MSNITEEDVMKYCYSRNLMLVTKESLEYMHRPIVVETINKDAIPVEWIEKWVDTLKERNYHSYQVLMPALIEMLGTWEKENE